MAQVPRHLPWIAFNLTNRANLHSTIGYETNEQVQRWMAKIDIPDALYFFSIVSKDNPPILSNDGHFQLK